MIRLIRPLLRPLPGPVAALLAILLTVMYLDRGWKSPVIVVLAAAGAITVSYLGGRLAFKRWPYYAGFCMEAGLGLLMLGAALAGAVILWLAIEKAPGTDASTREKETWAALSAAITAYLASIVIKPEGKRWNPVGDAVRKVFGGKFKDETPLAKDARDAALLDSYGAQAPSHKGDRVEGWGWDARRMRTRHIQDRIREQR